MMKEFGMRRKVRCHRRAVENYISSKIQECWSSGIPLFAKEAKDGAPDL
jgi:hypothetical protein